MGGVHPLLLVMFLSTQCGACSCPCHFHTSHPMASHIRAALYRSAARPTWGLLLGQSYMAWRLWDSWETPGWGSARGPAVSPPQICSVPQIGFSSNILVQDYLKSSGLPSALAYYPWGLKMHNILNHYSLFRERGFCMSKNLSSLFAL